MEHKRKEIYAWITREYNLASMRFERKRKRERERERKREREREKDRVGKYRIVRKILTRKKKNK